MALLKAWDDYLRHCQFDGELQEVLHKRYPPHHPWIFENAVIHSEKEQHFTVNFRNFDGSQHLTVGVKRIDGKYHYTFSEK